MSDAQINVAANLIMGIWEISPKGTTPNEVLNALVDGAIITEEQAEKILQRILNS